ncbi:ComEA family DNA-binding protein [Ohtaekwangia kribbensis]|uniref:ComEA family DNA-binding protein n=1 Tax=Ohtaekwangia kribbensis TaxID=688913 RepID=A0ABW3KBU6_9BACT
MVIRRWLKNFFGFSRSQVNAFMILLPLMAALIFSQPAYRWYISHYGTHHPPEVHSLDSLIAQWEQATCDSVKTLSSRKTQSFFQFDPNRISQQQFQALGFTEKISKRIINYRAKGGRFKVKSDLLKMYGMDTTFYHELYPYILLPDKNVQKLLAENKPAMPFARARKETLKFDINMADTAQLKKIYGIGEKRALRIVAYRDKLGGFVSMDQLAEVYTLDSVVIDKLSQATFVGDKFIPQKIHINTASDRELAAHPYLVKSVAKAIVAYRFQHGKINSVEDLRKIQAFDAKTIQKITPYLDFE